jgi:hypothetical protein
MPEFTAWPKTLRLYRDIIVTEKIDGTNAGIHIEKLGDVADTYPDVPGLANSGAVMVGHDLYRLTAQSRKRLIYPGKDGVEDNFGFAGWVRENGAALVDALGEGLHFGEWWGHGIQRGYGLPAGERRFSLFNTDRHKNLFREIGGVRVERVPVLYHGMFSDREIRGALADLAYNGSVAAPGFMNPEGVCVWHSQTRSVFKVTLDNNDAGKWEQVADEG